MEGVTREDASINTMSSRSRQSQPPSCFRQWTAYLLFRFFAWSLQGVFSSRVMCCYSISPWTLRDWIRNPLQMKWPSDLVWYWSSTHLWIQRKSRSKIWRVSQRHPDRPQPSYMGYFTILQPSRVKTTLQLIVDSNWTCLQNCPDDRIADCHSFDDTYRQVSCLLFTSWKVNLVKGTISYLRYPIAIHSLRGESEHTYIKWSWWFPFY